ncbi:MAG: thrombospondin type 3 repeat-containing protein, partial [Myxococcales bacterium]|nr:thrombospondin type 3 repeat-containing protein [Myxococcales bacterium]
YNPGVRIIDPAVFRAFQTSDPDGDGLGDQCDPDDDGDGIDDCGTDGVCSETDNGADDDRDGRIDEDGECQPGSDRFEQCDRGDRDLQDNDADGWTDEYTERELPRIFWPGPDPDGSEDNCRKVPNPQQEDLDGDGEGDACDADDDGDGVPDEEDLCPLVADAGQGDLDGDGLGDACDEDGDGDGIDDAEDPCP